MTTESCADLGIDVISAIDSIAGMCGTYTGDEHLDAAWRPQDNGASAESEIASVRVARALASLSNTLALPRRALDIYDMSTRSAPDCRRIAKAIARDTLLHADLLRLANSARFISSGTPAVDLEQAVSRIGSRRVGDMALATSVQETLRADAGRVLNVDLARRRSVAAGAALDLLVSETEREEVGEGLLLSALLQPLYRMTLAALFPHHYWEMAQRCERFDVTLESQEARLFPLSHKEVIERIARAWRIPSAACEPLMYLRDAYSDLAALPEPLRTRVELLKLVVAIGQLAVEGWESWDCIEPPPTFVLRQSGCQALTAAVASTKRRLGEMAAPWLEAPAEKRELRGPNAAAGSFGELAYCCLSAQSSDYVAEVVSSMGIRLLPRPLDAIGANEGVLINCLWKFPHPLVEWRGGASAGRKRLIVTDVTHAQPCARYGRVLTLPASYGSLRKACREIAAQ